MKILVLCRRGKVRSATLAESLRRIGHEAIFRGACVCDNWFTKEECEWADKIIIFEGWIRDLLDDYLNKVVYVGNVPDTYFDPDDEKLIEFCNKLLPYLKRYGIE